MTQAMRRSEELNELNENLREGLNDLVNKGVITQKQAEDIIYILQRANLTRNEVGKVTGYTTGALERDVSLDTQQLVNFILRAADERYFMEEGYDGSPFSVRNVTAGDVLYGLFMMEHPSFEVKGEFEKQWNDVLAYAQRRGFLSADTAKRAMAYYSFLISWGYTQDQALNEIKKYFAFPVSHFVSVFAPRLGEGGMTQRGDAYNFEMNANPWRYFHRFKKPLILSSTPRRV